jgi:SAM-dependent methyltransferase
MSLQSTDVQWAAPGIASWAIEWARGTLRDPAQHLQRRSRRECPCCGFFGLFVSAKRGHEREFRCPQCKSRPRDRFLALLLRRRGLDLTTKHILHFAPEWPLFNRLRGSPIYIGADIIKRRNANAVRNITAIADPDASFDVLICNHVLEHVPDDAAAMRECRRVLKPGGVAFFSVPVDMDRDTWEPPPGTPTEEVERICGWDHKRLYGRDIVERLRAAGFSVEVDRPTEDLMRRHRILHEDVFFVCR